MSYFMVDIEADGPIPGDYSMVCFGAVIVEPDLERMFYGRLKPTADLWISEALNVSGFTREETLSFDDPKAVMQTEHTHDPLDDAKGNAEALLAIKEQYGLRISL